MTIKATQIIGLDIISLATGSKVETVTDVLYDPAKQQVVGLLVDQGGWFSEARIILISQVHSIGKDAVIIPNELVIKTDSQVPERVSVIANSEQTLVKDNVVTEQGLKLGRVSDLIFEFPGGQVVELEVSQGTIGNLASGKKTVKTRDIVTVGENLIVSGFTEIDFAAQGQDQGLVGAGKSAQEKLAEGLKKTQEVATQAAQTIGQKSQEFGQIAKEKAVMAKDAVVEKTAPVIDNAKEQYQSGQMQHSAEQVIDRTKDFVATKASDSQELVAKTTQSVQAKALDAGAQAVLGKRVGNITLLGLQDQVLAVPGDLITHELITKCEQNKMLDKLIQNAV